MIRLLAAGLTMGLAGAPGLAQETPAPDIAGQWRFMAEIGGDCVFQGEARLTPTADPSFYGCELKARQTCPSTEIDYVVRQSCSAERSGDALAIVSMIETFERGEPTPDYFPDDFALTIRSSNHMSGALLSAGGADPAEFRRALEAVS